MDNIDPKQQDPPSDFTLRDEVNALVAWAFRNGPFEKLHIGKWSPFLEDPSLSRVTGSASGHRNLADPHTVVGAFDLIRGGHRRYLLLTRNPIPSRFLRARERGTQAVSRSKRQETAIGNLRYS